MLMDKNILKYVLWIVPNIIFPKYLAYQGILLNTDLYNNDPSLFAIK